VGGFVAWVVVDSRNGNCGGFLAEISCVWLRERGMVKMVVEIGAALAAAFLFPVKIRETRKIPEFEGKAGSSPGLAPGSE